MEELSLDVAADYIYMAALLIHIKSKMLLPHDETRRRSRIRARSSSTACSNTSASKRSPNRSRSSTCCAWASGRGRATPIPGTDASEIDMSEVGLFDLIDAFRTALNRYKQNHPQSIELQRTVHKISDKMRELYAKLQEKSPIRLQWFLEGRDRNELIAIFLARSNWSASAASRSSRASNFGEILIASTEKTIDEAQFAVFDNS